MHLRIVTSLAALVAAAFALAAEAAAETKVTARLDWAAYGLHAPFFVGLEKGWFKEKGLAVTVEDGNGSAKTITLVGAGQVEIGHANLSAMILAKAKSVPVTSVGHIVRKSDVGFLVPANSGWKTPKDLEGKKVAITPGGFVDPFLDDFLKRGGTSRDKMTIMMVTAQAKDATYIAGEADAMISTVPFMIPTLADKRASAGILFADYGLPLPGFGLVANDDWVKKNPAAARDFVQVFFRALDHMYASPAHKAEAVAAFKKQRPDTKASEAVLLGHIDAFGAYFNTDATKGKPSGWHAPADWETTIKLMIDAKLIPETVKPSDVYTNAFIAGGSS
ncbi:MAG: ABC transporter substrate-binding protein [Alphaproteobacteria bacterium]|nr:ABC transporter substrate-binding protein [Alphaproteobacteria bacterium]